MGSKCLFVAMGSQGSFLFLGTHDILGGSSNFLGQATIPRQRWGLPQHWSWLREPGSIGASDSTTISIIVGVFWISLACFCVPVQ